MKGVLGLNSISIEIRRIKLEGVGDSHFLTAFSSSWKCGRQPVDKILLPLLEPGKRLLKGTL